MPKLLWVSPLSVHDTSSASAIQTRNMLLSLKARGVDIIALSALNFVDDSGTAMFTDLDEKLKGAETSFNLTDFDINFIYIRTNSRRLGDMISLEQRNFYGKMCAIINAFRPDVVMGTGYDMLSMVCFDEAKRRGIPTAYYLLDDTPNRFNFPNVDVAVTDSNAFAEHYANVRNINVMTVGSFLQVNGPLAREQDAQQTLHVDSHKLITMVEPTVEKGLALFLSLVREAQNSLKDYTFAVKETVEGQFAAECQRLHEKDNAALNLPEVKIFDAKTPLSEVFAQSRALVAPSVRFERINGTLREAIAHGIPVLGSSITGIAESIDQAGMLVAIPAASLQDNALLLSAEEIAPFVQTLQSMIKDNFDERCAKATKNFDVGYSANRLLTVLRPLFAQHAGNNPQLLRSGSII